MPTYEEALARLRGQEDIGYRDFHKKLLKNESINVIGVRMPILRKIAKEYKEDWRQILTFPDEFYEITFLKCAVVGMLPFEEFCREVDGVVALLDNWATCDCFTAPCIKKHKAEFLPYIEKYLSDEREFVKRYALVTLLHDYVEEEYLPYIFTCACQSGNGQYYVDMAAAWLIAEVLVKFYARGVAFLKEQRLPAEVARRAIQKARESFRLSKEQKEELKAIGAEFFGKRG